MTQPPRGDEAATGGTEPGTGQQPGVPAPRRAPAGDQTSPVGSAGASAGAETGSTDPAAGTADAPVGPADATVPGDPTPAPAPVPAPDGLHTGHAVPGQPSPGHPPVGQPPPHQPGPVHATPSGYPSAGTAPAPPRRRRAVLIASVALAVTLVLCLVGGVSAFLVVHNLDTGEGATDPVAAVDGFLKAVYTEQNPEKAAGLVCAEARDHDRIERKIQEVVDYARRYADPRYRWTEPQLDEQDSERAIVSTTLTVLTADERTADQRLRFIVVEKTGWWVCDVF